MKKKTAVPPTPIQLGKMVRLVGKNRFMEHQVWLVKTDQPPRFDGYGSLVWVKWESTRHFEEVYEKYVQPLYIKGKRVRRSPRQAMIQERKRIWEEHGYYYRPSEQAADYKFPEKKKRATKKKRAPKKKVQPPRKRCFHKGGKMVLINDSGEYFVPEDLSQNDDIMECGEEKKEGMALDEDYPDESSNESGHWLDPDLLDLNSTDSFIEPVGLATPCQANGKQLCGCDHPQPQPDVPCRRIVTPQQNPEDMKGASNVTAGNTEAENSENKNRRKHKLLAPCFAGFKKRTSLKKPPPVNEGGSSSDKNQVENGNSRSGASKEMDLEAMVAKIARAMVAGGVESHVAESQDSGTSSKDTEYEEMGAKIGREIGRALSKLKNTKVTPKRVVFVDLCDSDDD